MRTLRAYQRQLSVMDAERAADAARLDAELAELAAVQDAHGNGGGVAGGGDGGNGVVAGIGGVLDRASPAHHASSTKALAHATTSSSTASLSHSPAPASASPLASSPSSSSSSLSSAGVQYAPALPTDLLFKLDLDVGQGRTYQFNYFRGSDCAGMAYEFASKLGMPAAASQVRIAFPSCVDCGPVKNTHLCVCHCRE